jgi:hypothetical protein
MRSLIPQGFSWDQLKISADGIKRLFHCLGVFPLALDMLCAFGEQTTSISDSLGSCHSYSRGDFSGIGSQLSLHDMHELIKSAHRKLLFSKDG